MPDEFIKEKLDLIHEHIEAISKEN